MKTYFSINIVILFLIFTISCSKSNEKLIIINEVSPWCILGFDSLDRSPEQRISMLKEMGLSKYGFNKGKGHLDEMQKEFKLASDNSIEISSIFLWLNAKRDSIGKLSLSNQQLLGNLKAVEQRPTIWLSFSDNYFEEKSQKESIDFAVEMTKFIKRKADEVGCELALYNHHGWFGNPYNQIEILEELMPHSITMVFNFHHSQEYVDDFTIITKKMKPYLSYVNISGVEKEGPQIITIGEGDHEFEMIKTLMDQGFHGPWGILGHIKDEDVQKVLNRNIEGLKQFNSTFSPQQ